MKQFSIIINFILLIAVGVLYYLFFNSSKKSNVLNTSLINPLHINHNASNVSFPQLAYVELDSINKNVYFIKKRKKELELEQKQIMNEYESACRQQEFEKTNFIKRGNSITQEEAETFQAKWLSRQQDVETIKQNKGEKLAERGSKIIEEMQSTLKDFLNNYNKEKRYTYIFATGGGYDYLFYKDSCQNITAEIVNGLNERMKKNGKR